jgi:SpoVK/Ycf46/Vps4 family AAA+-type ATPase
MTTNHPDKLDPALIRHGRVHFILQLTYMKSKCAYELIEKYFGPHDINIRDDLISPCDLEAYCSMSKKYGVEKLKYYLSEHFAGRPH